MKELKEIEKRIKEVCEELGFHIETCQVQVRYPSQSFCVLPIPLPDEIPKECSGIVELSLFAIGEGPLLVRGGYL